MARAPGRVRLAIAVSIPDVPVPETANENAPSAARKTRPSRARTSSRIASRSGSRWLSTGADIARITRGATGLGPGPSSRRSDVVERWGGIEEHANPFHGIGGERRERRPRLARVKAREVESGFQS